MIKVSALTRELVDGHVVGGIDFYYTPGDNVVLFQMWEHRASGAEYNGVEVSYMRGDFATYWSEHDWSDEYQIDETEEL